LKQYTLRLRLERAAGELIATNRSLLTIALASGFASHEVFTRAFTRRFGMSPKQHRLRGRATMTQRERLRQRELINAIGPCIPFYQVSLDPSPRSRNMPTLSISRKEITPQPILYIRRRIAHSEIQTTMAECFGQLYGHGQKNGLPIAGFPMARWVSTGPGLLTLDSAMPLAVPATGEGEMQADQLPGGSVAFAIHAGPYDQLNDTHAAMERWIEANGYRVAGPYWDWFVTDPGEHPDPKDWRTEVFWPLEV
jgi:AraC family transcriptional regulator